MNTPHWYTLYNQVDLFDSSKDIFNIHLSLSNVRIVIGQFFELLAGKILKANNELTNNNNVDIVLWNNKSIPYDLLFEVKGSKSTFLFDYNQLVRYHKLKSFPYTNPQLYYVLFLYNVPETHIQLVSVSNLLKRLSESIVSCLILPLDIVWKLSKCIPLLKYGQYWNTGGRELYLRLKESETRLLMNGVDSSIIPIIQYISKNKIKLSGYKTKRCIISILDLGYCNVQSFPLIIVSKDLPAVSSLFNA